MRSLSRFSGVIAGSERLVPLCGTLFDLTGNHVQVVLFLLEIITLMRLVKV